ncbi:MAG: BrnA antitoxin family protein [Rhizomicrobium sp.]
MARKSKQRVVVDDVGPELTAADFSRAKRMRDVMPEVVEAMKRGRGRPKIAQPKERVSLRLAPKIIAAYKATGEGWQSRINGILARALPQQKPKRRGAKASRPAA